MKHLDDLLRLLLAALLAVLLCRAWAFVVRRILERPDSTDSEIVERVEYVR